MENPEFRVQHLCIRGYTNNIFLYKQLDCKQALHYKYWYNHVCLSVCMHIYVRDVFNYLSSFYACPVSARVFSRSYSVVWRPLNVNTTKIYFSTWFTSHFAYVIVMLVCRQQCIWYECFVCAIVSFVIIDAWSLACYCRWRSSVSYVGVIRSFA